MQERISDCFLEKASTSPYLENRRSRLCMGGQFELETTWVMADYGNAAPRICRLLVVLRSFCMCKARSISGHDLGSTRFLARHGFSDPVGSCIYNRKLVSCSVRSDTAFNKISAALYSGSDKRAISFGVRIGWCSRHLCPIGCCSLDPHTSTVWTGTEVAHALAQSVRPVC